MTICKTDIVNAVSQTENISKAAAEQAVNAVVQAISNELKAGNSVQLHGFGTFEVKERAARTGRNPRTKEPVEIPASKTATFKPAKALKTAL